MKRKRDDELSEELRAVLHIMLWVLTMLVLAILFLSYASSWLSDANATPTNHQTEDEMVEQKFTAWKDKCSKCHGSGDKATDYGIQLGAPKDLFNTAGAKNIEDIDSFIRKGHKDLPPFEKELSGEEIEILARFIKLGNTLQRIESHTDDIKPLLREEIIDGKRVLEL